jgi:insulysin
MSRIAPKTILAGRRRLLVALLAGLTCILGLTPVVQAATASDVIEIRKSSNDKRLYRYITLPNDLRVILISEPDAQVSAASLDVRVGSSDDPQDRAGLAHFLEHMLFLGTDKFPSAGEYQAFVSSHGGSQNAYTGSEHTNFHFTVEASALAGTLERFSRFFIAPVMDAQYVERERQVVQAEYSSNLKSDGRRSFSALKAVLNPAHPLSRFSVGSTTTLADRPDDNVRDDLLAFYRRYYVAGNMTLSILGADSLDQLEKLARTRFADVPPGAAPQRAPQPPYFAADTLPARLDIVPQREYRVVGLTFPIPSLLKHYRAKPITYIAHMLGHEGEGSLLSALRRRGLANSLSAGSGLSDAYSATFNVQISLTKAGFDALNDVVALVFRALNLIESVGPERSRFDEMARLNAVNFRFQEPSDAGRLTTVLSARLHSYPPADVVYASYALEEFEPELIRHFLSHLKPERMLLTVSAPGLETDKRTPYFDAPYRLSKLDLAPLHAAIQKADAAALRLPSPNLFIADDFSLLADMSDALPREVLRTPGLEAWHSQDTSFQVPLASFYVALRSKAANASARNSVLTQLLVGILNEQLNETTYPAAVAGMRVQLYKHLRGVSFRINGYSQRQRGLVLAVIEAIKNPQWEEDRFARMRDALVRNLNNRKHSSPYSQAMRETVNHILLPSWSTAAQLTAARAVDLASLREFFETQFLRGIDIAVLSHGNVDAETARAMAALVRSKFKAPADSSPVKRAQVLRLRPGDALFKHVSVEHIDRALAIYLQGRGRDLRERAAVALLAQIMSSPFYTELRTNQQLGYVVFANSMPMMQVPGLSLVIQSPSHQTSLLAQRARAFLVEFATTLRNLPGTSFDEFKGSLKSRLLEPDKTLDERTNRYWSDIDRGTTQFDERERLALVIEELTLADITATYDAIVVSADRAEIAIHASAEAAPLPTHMAALLAPAQLRKSRGVFE